MRPRRKNDTPAEPAPEQGAPMTIQTITLESDEPAQVLINGLRDADRIARDANEKGNAALADADRIKQGITDLDRREAELRAELDHIAQTRDKFTQQETDARTFAARQHAVRDEKAAAVAGYKRLLAMANVPVDEHLLVPTVPLNGTDPAADTRTDEHMRAFNAAHDEQQRNESEVDL
jgi:hypothetical protein